MPVLSPSSGAVTARDVIQDALSFHLNRLSPGEPTDADTLAVCLRALDNIADEWNGRKAFLFREVLTASAAPITGATGTLGTTWVGLASGDEILGATVAYSATLDVPLHPITMAQYQSIAIKSVSSLPENYAHDGATTVYFYPSVDTRTVTLRTKQAMATFADMDTQYTMPAGYRAALAACLSELMAPTMNPQLVATCTRAAGAARKRLALQNINPAVINANDSAGPVARIRRGF